MSNEIDFVRLGRIFAPYSSMKRDSLLGEGKRLAHYTSAANAMNMIQNKQVWLRNAKLMNDFREIEHGFDMLVRFFQNESDDAPDVGQIELFKTMDAMRPGLLMQAIHLFNSWAPTIREHTYVACLTEHTLRHDDTGRLSMWRGYGANDPAVAIVLNPTPFYLNTSGLGAYSSPVAYHSQDEFFEMLRSIRKAVESESDYIATVPDQALIGVIFNSLLLYAVCQKHEGFNEEQEWRVIHVPQLHTPTLLKKGVETVRGTPQQVQKLHFENSPDLGVVGIEIKDLVHHVIVGPAQFQGAVREAIIDKLEGAGVPDARSRVVLSSLPLRNV